MAAIWAIVIGVLFWGWPIVLGAFAIGFFLFVAEQFGSPWPPDKDQNVDSTGPATQGQGHGARLQANRIQKPPMPDSERRGRRVFMGVLVLACVAQLPILLAWLSSDAGAPPWLSWLFWGNLTFIYVASLGLALHGRQYRS